MAEGFGPLGANENVLMWKDITREDIEILANYLEYLELPADSPPASPIPIDELPEIDAKQEAFEGDPTRGGNLQKAVCQNKFGDGQHYIPDKRKSVKEEESIDIIIGEYYAPPKGEVPLSAYEEVIPCELLGFDSQGYVYIRFSNKYSENDYITWMRKMNVIYSWLDPSNVEIKKEDIHVGQILVGKVSCKRKPGDKELFLFVRVQVIRVDLQKNEVLTVDIDEQKLLEFLPQNLFNIIEHFYNQPVKSVKCGLAGLDYFDGTGVVPFSLASSSVECELNMFVKLVKETNPNDPSVSPSSFRVPRAILYRTELESKLEYWSFNQNLFEAIKSYNKEPFAFENGMVLTKVAITYADTRGLVWVQLQSEMMKLLSNIPTNDKFGFSNPDHILNIVTALYQSGTKSFVKEFNGAYRRVKVVEDLRKEEYEQALLVIVYNDYGVQDVCSLKDLLPFTLFNDLLEFVPNQGFHATLQSNSFHKVSHLTKADIETLTHNEVKVVIRVPFDVEERTPIIEVYFPYIKWSHNSSLADQFGSRPEHLNFRHSSPPEHLSHSSSLGASGPQPKKVAYVRFPVPVPRSSQKEVGRHFPYNKGYDLLKESCKNHIAVLEYI